MNEIRMTIIKNHTDPTQDKRVEVHVTDADAVLAGIKDTPDHQFKDLAGALAFLVTTALAKCADTDKIEIGPGGAFHCTAEGKTQFSL